MTKGYFQDFRKGLLFSLYHKADLKYFLHDVGETPYAMHLAHLKLIDLHRTLGPARYWFTIAPGLWAHQWHHWVEDALMKSASNLGDCGVSETMVLLHNLNELFDINVSASCGGVYGDSPFWLPVPDETSVIATAARLEYQEGARNTDRPYYGTGLPLLHVMSPSRFVRR